MLRLGIRGVLLAAVMAVAAPSLAQTAASAPDQFENLRKRLDAQKAEPMTFYIAKGAPHSCGDGCDTWIAAEGPFDPEAAQRLRNFLSEPGRPQLPLFFQSPGGSVSQALQIGRVLRLYKMRAGVARTVPVGCNPSARREELCDRMKRSGRELTAELRFTAASCVSACVYALLGALTREVAPDADLGVHASIVFRVRTDGHVYEAAPGQLEQLNAVTRRYVEEMGIETGLLDITFDTLNENMRYLTRDEIIKFKIDPRRAIETRWALDPSAAAPTATKTIFEVRDHGPAEYRWSYLRLSCGSGDKAKLQYIRVLATPEETAAKLIKLTGRDLEIDFPPVRPGKSASTADQSITVSLKTLEAAAGAPSLAIAATFSPPEAEPWSTTTTISTSGLASALEGLRPRCE